MKLYVKNAKKYRKQKNNLQNFEWLSMFIYSRLPSMCWYFSNSQIMSSGTKGVRDRQHSDGNDFEKARMIATAYSDYHFISIQLEFISFAWSHLTFEVS